MAESNSVKGGKFQSWWQKRIIRTKILIGIFVGVFIFQGVLTTYQMQKVESDILTTYNDKALNLSVAIDCIVLKDGILFFNLLDRIGRTEVVGIKIDDNHPSCVERQGFLERLEASFVAKNNPQQAAPENTTSEQTVAEQLANLTPEELAEIEIIRDDEDTAANTASAPLNLVFDTEKIQGTMEETTIVIDNQEKTQLLYTVPVNGVEVTFDLTNLPELKLNRFIGLTGTALVNLAILFIIIWVIAGQIVEPLKKLTDFTQKVIKSGAIQKGETIELVKSPAKDEVGILTKAFNQMIARLQKSYLQIIRSKAAIGDLLDNTGQGFFSFGPDLKINEEYSKACQVFFQREIDGMDALDLMVPDKKGEVKELIDLVFNGVGDLKMLEDLLPQEIELSGRILDMDYRFIQATSKDIGDKMMVILTDVTQERELAALLKKDEMINELIIRIARDKDGFIQFVQETDDFLVQSAEEFKLQSKPLDSNLLMRQFHTLKGGSASFGLIELSEHAHVLEDEIQKATKENRLDSGDLFNSLAEKANKMVYVLRNSLDHVQDIVTWEEIDQSRSRVYRIPKTKLDQLEQLIDKSGEVSAEKLKNAIRELKKQPIKPVLKKYANTAKSMADKLGKKVSVITRGSEIEVPYERLNPLFDTLVHLVRNSVDHGLEDMATRQEKGKPEEGNLVIEAKLENGKYRLLITDDGGGIDPERIKSIAVKKGLIKDNQAKALSDDEAIKLIFKPGFSTSDTVSDISGRGVGMDAVKAALKDVGGTIAIRTFLNKGTSFILSIPV